MFTQPGTDAMTIDSPTDLAAVLAAMQQMTGQIAELRELIVEQRQIKDFYSTAEFAALVERDEFTVREWCRRGRIFAAKKNSGRGAHLGWAVAHEELLRYRREGLLPERRA